MSHNAEVLQYCSHAYYTVLHPRNTYAATFIMAALCYIACGSWSSYETSILILPVAWNANTPYFMPASQLEETTCNGVVPLRGTIILAGHRRLIIGRISHIVSIHQTFVILSIYGAVNEQMREKVEVHLRVPYNMLTKKAHWLGRVHKFLFGSLNDNSLPQAPGMSDNTTRLPLSLTQCRIPCGRFHYIDQQMPSCTGSFGIPLPS